MINCNSSFRNFIFSIIKISQMLKAIKLTNILSYF